MPYSAQLAILDLYIPCPPPPPPPPPPSNHHRYSEDALGDQLSDMDLAIDTMVWDADREQQQPGSDDCGSSSSSSSSSEARAQVRRMQEAGERRFESLEAKVERLRSRLGMRRRVGEDGAGGDGEGRGGICSRSW
ncbi:hypothetical protein H2203_004273 [Taxawa tesnikishii (nom. ined.)]|nr:hypothetical protein H2203_004273 [Dothideales sp. JES 119]